MEQNPLSVRLISVRRKNLEGTTMKQIIKKIATNPLILGSLAGLYGSQVQRLARRLHKARLYTTYGTDAHSAGMITKMELSA